MLIDFRERERKGERGKERNIHAREKHPLAASHTRGRTCNLGKYPDQELNL